MLKTRYVMQATEFFVVEFFRKLHTFMFVIGERTNWNVTD